MGICCSKNKVVPIEIYERSSGTAVVRKRSGRKLVRLIRSPVGKNPKTPPDSPQLLAGPVMTRSERPGSLVSDAHTSRGDASPVHVSSAAQISAEPGSSCVATKLNELQLTDLDSPGNDLVQTSEENGGRVFSIPKVDLAFGEDSDDSCSELSDSSSEYEAPVLEAWGSDNEGATRKFLRPSKFFKSLFRKKTGSDSSSCSSSDSSDSDDVSIEEIAGKNEYLTGSPLSILSVDDEELDE